MVPRGADRPVTRVRLTLESAPTSGVRALPGPFRVTPPPDLRRAILEGAPGEVAFRRRLNDTVFSMYRSGFSCISQSRQDYL